jgi:hypothetical protein
MTVPPKTLCLHRTLTLKNAGAIARKVLRHPALQRQDCQKPARTASYEYMDFRAAAEIVPPDVQMCRNAGFYQAKLNLYLRPNNFMYTFISGSYGG